MDIKLFVIGFVLSYIFIKYILFPTIELIRCIIEGEIKKKALIKYWKINGDHLDHLQNTLKSEIRSSSGDTKIEKQRVLNNLTKSLPYDIRNDI